MKARANFKDLLKGLASIEGKTMLEKQRDLEDEFTLKIKDFKKKNDKKTIWDKRIF